MADHAPIETSDGRFAYEAAGDPDLPPQHRFRWWRLGGANYVYYYRSLFTKLKRNGRIELFKTHRDQPDDEGTLDMICDKLVIYGHAGERRRPVLAFHDEVGPFGTLLYAGNDWKDPRLDGNR